MGRFGRHSNTSKENLANGQQGRPIGRPFRLSAWLRLHGVDLITMALMGALGLGIYFAGQ